MSFLGLAIDVWWGWMAGVVWQAAVLVALAWGVERVLSVAFGRGACARIRMALWVVVLLKLITGPWVWSPLSVAGAFRAPVGPASGAISDPGGHGWWMAALGVVWITGVAFFGVVAIRRRAGLARVVGSGGGGGVGGADAPRLARLAGEAARRLGMEDRLRRGRVRVVLGEGGGVFVFGALRPTVLVGRRALDAMTDREALHALMHELMHVRRRDALLCAVATMLRVLYWFNPLVWYAGRRIRALVELGCDRDVARALGAGETPVYRRTLALAAARMAGIDATRAGLGMATGRSMIVERLAALERDDGRGRTWAGRAGAGAIGALAAVCVAPMGLRPSPSDAGGARPDMVVAMQTAASAARDEGGVGCLRVRYAAMAMASGTQAPRDGGLPPG